MFEYFNIVDFNVSRLTEPVIAVNLCGYRNDGNVGDDDGSSPTNHWTMFLEHEDGTSERVDLKARYDGDGWRGEVEIVSKGYSMTIHAIKKLSFPASAHVTVESVMILINSQGRQWHMFTNAVQGCRFWNWNLIVDLETASFIPAGSALTTWEAMAYYYRDPDGKELRPLQKGTFY
jgi:hypothetical protein